MDSINSWINEEEVRQLADDLTASPEVVKEWQGSDVDDGFAIPERQGDASVSGVEQMVVVDDVAEEIKVSQAASLAGASAMAASAGLLGGGKFVRDSEVDKVEERIASGVNVLVEGDDSHVTLCDDCINTVPGDLSVGVGDVSPSVHAEKQLGTFEQIDRQLAKTVRTRGICVIDRDGDVLYSSMENDSLVAFTIDSMMDTNLMRVAEGEFGNICLKLSAVEYMEFVSVKSTRGVLVLAASLEHVLGSKNAGYVAGDVLKIANQG